MSYVSVGKENSTDIELYYKDHGGQSGRPDPRMRGIPTDLAHLRDCESPVLTTTTASHGPVTQQTALTFTLWTVRGFTRWRGREIAPAESALSI